MENLFTAAEIADAIAAAEGWGEPARSKLHRQVKHWCASGLLPPIASGTDGRGTNLFDHYAVVKARLYVACADIGLSVDDIRSVAGEIGTQHHNGIRMRVHQVATAKEECYCVITIFREISGSRVVHAGVYPSYPTEVRTFERECSCDTSPAVQSALLIPLRVVLLPVIQSLFEVVA